MKLVSGEGSPETGACWMSALHYYTRHDESWTDQAPWACVSPVIRTLCITLNDRLGSDEERGRVIGPHLFTPLGTNTGIEDDRKRAFLCADYAVRRFAPIVLDACGRLESAARLRALPPIVDAASALVGRDMARAADAANAAKAAKGAAAAKAAAASAAGNAARAASAAWCPAAAATVAADAAATVATVAYAAYAAAHANVRALHLQLILDCCAIGSRVEVEPVCSRDAVMEVCR